MDLKKIPMPVAISVIVVLAAGAIWVAWTRTAGFTPTSDVRPIVRQIPPPKEGAVDAGDDMFMMGSQKPGKQKPPAKGSSKSSKS